MYCKCGTTVHPVRINLGYKTCVQCSTTKTYSYVPIIEHKTGNTIQIVSQEVSASVHRAWRRKQLDEQLNQVDLKLTTCWLFDGFLHVSEQLANSYMIKGVIPQRDAKNGSMIVATGREMVR